MKWTPFRMELLKTIENHQKPLMDGCQRVHDLCRRSHDGCITHGSIWELQQSGPHDHMQIPSRRKKSLAYWTSIENILSISTLPVGEPIPHLFLICLKVELFIQHLILYLFFSYSLESTCSFKLQIFTGIQPSSQPAPGTLRSGREWLVGADLPDRMVLP